MSQNQSRTGVVAKTKSVLEYTPGERFADWVATTIGSWRFIIFQSIFIAIWIVINSTGILLWKWDPYPFIFLNLALSFQAAYTAPIIMMSQNRQEDLDRAQIKKDYEINVLAEHEIESIQEKLNSIEQHVVNRMLLKDDLQDIRSELETLKSLLNYPKN